MCIFVASCRAFTITAVAQLCLLGTMWIFGCFQFDESTIISSYLFTIFGSFQGIMLFVMHCLFSKQVSQSPLKNKKLCCFFWCQNSICILVSGEGRIWKHPVQILCTWGEELLKLQFLAHKQSSCKPLFWCHHSVSDSGGMTMKLNCIIQSFCHSCSLDLFS